MARRLSLMCRKTKICRFHMVGACNRGKACDFAHGDEEMKGLPDLSCTKICPLLLHTGRCMDEECTFAHTREELRNASLEKERARINQMAVKERAAAESATASGAKGHRFLPGAGRANEGRPSFGSGVERASLSASDSSNNLCDTPTMGAMGGYAQGPTFVQMCPFDLETWAGAQQDQMQPQPVELVFLQPSVQGMEGFDGFDGPRPMMAVPMPMSMAVPVPAPPCVPRQFAPSDRRRAAFAVGMPAQPTMDIPIPPEVMEGDGQPDVNKALRNKFRKTKMCTFFLSGRCRKGAVCNFAHHKDELMPLPDLYRTKLCPMLAKTGECDDPMCKYAHSEDELRNLCNFMQGGDLEDSMSGASSAGDAIPTTFSRPPPSLPREVLLAALESGPDQAELPIICTSPDREESEELFDFNETAVRQCTDPGPNANYRAVSGMLEDTGFYRQYTEPGPPGRDLDLGEDESAGLGGVKKYRNLKIKNTFLTVVPEDGSLMPRPLGKTRSSPDLMSLGVASSEDNECERRDTGFKRTPSGGSSSGHTTSGPASTHSANAASGSEDLEGSSPADQERRGNIGSAMALWGYPAEPLTLEGPLGEDGRMTSPTSGVPAPTSPMEPRSSTPPKRKISTQAAKADGFSCVYST